MEANKNRSFHRKYVTLKQILHEMNDIFIITIQMLSTFAAENLIHKSTNQLKDQQWNN